MINKRMELMANQEILEKAITAGVILIVQNIFEKFLSMMIKMVTKNDGDNKYFKSRVNVYERVRGWEI